MSKESYRKQYNVMPGEEWRSFLQGYQVRNDPDEIVDAILQIAEYNRTQLHPTIIKINDKHDVKALRRNNDIYCKLSFTQSRRYQYGEIPKNEMDIYFNISNWNELSIGKLGCRVQECTNRPNAGFGKDGTYLEEHNMVVAGSYCLSQLTSILEIPFVTSYNSFNARVGTKIKYGFDNRGVSTAHEEINHFIFNRESDDDAVSKTFKDFVVSPGHTMMITTAARIGNRTCLRFKNGMDEQVFDGIVEHTVYRNPAQCVVGMENSCNKIFWDGESYYMTLDAALCHYFRINPIDWRSASEIQIDQIKSIVRAGFSIVVPKLRVPEQVELNSFFFRTGIMVKKSNGYKIVRHEDDLTNLKEYIKIKYNNTARHKVKVLELMEMFKAGYFDQNRIESIESEEGEHPPYDRRNMYAVLLNRPKMFVHCVYPYNLGEDDLDVKIRTKNQLWCALACTEERNSPLHSKRIIQYVKEITELDNDGVSSDDIRIMDIQSKLDVLLTDIKDRYQDFFSDVYHEAVEKSPFKYVNFGQRVEPTVGAIEYVNRNYTKEEVLKYGSILPHVEFWTNSFVAFPSQSITWQYMWPLYIMMKRGVIPYILKDIMRLIRWHLYRGWILDRIH
tara:strand:- start:4773 stop:6620 length:1848 start_codon:yes stop_codon:yes gene_type:complete